MPGNINDDVTLTRTSQRTIVLRDSLGKTGDRVGVSDTAVGYAADHFFPPKCAAMLRDIVFRLDVDVFRQAI